MISDLAIAKLGFAESRNSSDALLTVAKLRLEVEAVRTEATGDAEAMGMAEPDVSVEINSVEPDTAKPATHDRVDRKV